MNREQHWQQLAFSITAQLVDKCAESDAKDEKIAELSAKIEELEKKAPKKK